MTAIVYLHGFRSSPASVKARQLEAAVAALPTAHRPRLHIPALAYRPLEAVAQVAAWVDSNVHDEQVTFLGSSLGGFYATYLAQRYDVRAAMINPAVHPARDLAPWIGPQTNLYTGEVFEVMPQHFGELAGLEVPRITRPERYFLLVETGDELLDYREAVSFYAGAWQYVRGGGDHSFSDFAEQIPAILRFAGVFP